MDAVPVTSPPVAAGGGVRSGGGSLQQAERTRAEETLRVSAGGNATHSFPLPCAGQPQGTLVGTWQGGCPQALSGLFSLPAGTGPKGEKGEKGERGLKGDSGTGSIVGTGSIKGEKVGDRGHPRGLGMPPTCLHLTPTSLCFCPTGGER